MYLWTQCFKFVVAFFVGQLAWIDEKRCVMCDIGAVFEELSIVRKLLKGRSHTIVHIALNYKTRLLRS